jgi:cobalt-zinc-cadmium efflux system outer membrane protein
MKKSILLLLIIVYFNFNSVTVSAQNTLTADSISLTLTEAESLFLKNNFSLIAANYKISEAEAATIQAKIWALPTLSIDQGAYNHQTKNWFSTGKDGQTAISLQQFIELGGKRKKRIAIEKINSEIAGCAFYDLMRSLRYDLRSAFYHLYYLQKANLIYNEEIEALQNLIKGFTIQYANGNISFNELTRLKTLLFSIENEKVNLTNDASTYQRTLTLLTGDTLLRKIKPVAEWENMPLFKADTYSLMQVLDTTMLHRYDVLAAQKQIKQNELNLALQKKINIPDLTLGANYDKSGSYINNYNSVSLQFDLPFWNRNKGNIRIADFQVKESQNEFIQKQMEAKTEVEKAYTNLIAVTKLVDKTKQDFTTEYEKLRSGILKGYQNRTINLLEFLDYYENFKQSQIQFYQLQNNYLDAVEEFNFSTGKIWN